MARSFNGSSDAITVPVNLIAYNQLSVSFWLNWTTFANNDALAMEYSPNFGTNDGSFIIDPNSGGPTAGVFYSAVNAGGMTLARFARPSAGWHHYLFHLDSNAGGTAAVPATYVDGSSQSLTYDLSASVGGVNFGTYNLYLMSRNASALWGAGSMADMAIWGVLLTATEAQGLAQGARPSQIRPANLVCWLPLDGLQSPEPDLSSKACNGTLAGTAFAFGPSFMPFTPRGRSDIDVVTAAPSFIPAWAQRAEVMGAGLV